MKPIQLSMTAFGPYKEKEIIDFTELEEHQLFVISGATGAGKTTIFDGICFALYGTASGTDRDNIMMLRSHFADDHVHTAVELIFELKGSTYRILRQLGHVKQGNKSKTGDRYEFYEIVGDEEVPCVDRQIVSEINTKMEALIGLTEDQFKQIVMLPQGEFRKLLTSETENKEEILRRLFQTQRYQQMNVILKEKQTTLQQSFEQESHMLQRHLQSILTSLEKRENAPLFTTLEQESYNPDQVISGLEEEITFLQKQMEQDETIYHKSLTDYEAKQKELTYRAMINQRFATLENKRQQLKQLLYRTDEMEQKEKRLLSAERASLIEPYEKQVIGRTEEVQVKKQHLLAAEKKLTIAKQTLEQVSNAYREEEAKSDERERISTELARYEEFLPIVEKMEQEKQQIGLLQQTIQRKEAEAKNVTKQIETSREQMQQLKNDIKVKEAAVSVLGDKQVEQNELRNQYKLLEQYSKENNRFQLLQKTAVEKEQAYHVAKEQLQKVEANWMHQQASVLAHQLQEGEACPVCGSTNHPNKHETAGNLAVSKEELESYKRVLEEKQKEFHSIKGELQALSPRLEQLTKDIAVFNVLPSQVEQHKVVIVKKGQHLTHEIDTLKKMNQQLLQAKEKLEQLDGLIKQATSQKELLDSDLAKLKADLSGRQATFTERIRPIPLEMQHLDTLQQKVKEMTILKTNLEKRWKEIGEQLKRTEESCTTAQTNVINQSEQLKELISHLEKAEKMLQDQLQSANFLDFETYLQAKMPKAARDEMKKECENFKQETTTLSKQIEEQAQELANEKPIDLHTLETAVLELKQQYETALKQMNESRKYSEIALNIKKNILHTQAQLGKVEKELLVVKDVYDVLRGQNAKKISFERYLQIDYLDQIIQAANIRFRNLTDGQYHLTRSDRQETHGRQSGLAIDVYDAYTGQMRDVKTLSGGEKFIASLCLALGMSDVIQSFQGNIQIETMFIDEGFGSLDEESLNKSIDALVQLQQTGRTVGVISHVQELKNIFPVTLEVNKTKEGYSTTEFIVR